MRPSLLEQFLPDTTTTTTSHWTRKLSRKIDFCDVNFMYIYKKKKREKKKKNSSQLCYHLKFVCVRERGELEGQLKIFFFKRKGVWRELKRKRRLTSALSHTILSFQLFPGNRRYASVVVMTTRAGLKLKRDPVPEYFRFLGRKYAWFNILQN